MSFAACRAQVCKAMPMRRAAISVPALVSCLVSVVPVSSVRAAPPTQGPTSTPTLREGTTDHGSSAATTPAPAVISPAGAVPTASSTASTPLDTLYLGTLSAGSQGEPPSTVALGPDEVELNDGGFVRGTIVESRPGVLVRIVVAGEATPRTLPWSEVKAVARGKYDPAVAPATPGWGATPDDKTAGFAATGPRVHLVATRKTRGRLHLFEISGASVGTAYGYGRTTSVVATTYQRVCVEPCGEVVDTTRGSPYVVHAEGMMPTRTFELPRSGEVTVEIEPRKRALVGGGLALSFVGIAVMTTGLMFAVVEGVRENSDPGRLAGWSTMTVGGAGMVGGGLVMTLIRSKVRIRQGAPSR